MQRLSSSKHVLQCQWGQTPRLGVLPRPIRWATCPHHTFSYDSATCSIAAAAWNPITHVCACYVHHRSMDHPTKLDLPGPENNHTSPDMSILQKSIQKVYLSRTFLTMQAICLLLAIGVMQDTMYNITNRGQFSDL